MRNKQRTALVLGGTGVMGSYLVDILSQDYHVYVTTRQKKASVPNIDFLKGNAHDIEFLKSILAGKHYDAIIDFMNYSTEAYKMRYQFLLESTEQLFYISSARVYAKTEGKIGENSPRLLDVTTDTEFLKSDDYALAKARQEDLLRSSGKTNWTIIRPYMTYYRNKLDLGIYPKELWLYRVMHGKSVIFTDDVASKMTTLTHGTDVARVISRLIGHKEALGETFNITTSESMTWADVIGIYKNVLERKGYAMNVIMQSVSELPKQNIYRYDRIYNRIFDTSKIDHVTNTRDFVSVQEGITDALMDFIAEPHFSKIDWKMQAYCDSITKEHTSLKEITSVKEKCFYIIFRYFVSYPFVHNLIFK